MNPRHLGVTVAFAAVQITAAGGDLSWSSIPTLSFGPLDPKPAGTLKAMGVATRPIMQAGHPSPDPASGITPDSPDRRVDPNIAASPFAGVGSIFADDDPSDPFGIIATATAISPTRILTAAHAFDLHGTGGVSDVRPENTVFVLNVGGSFSHIIQASRIWIHPSYDGFASPNDDLAVVELSQPLPKGVPIYPLADPSWIGQSPVILAGYGDSGDGVNGYQVPANFDVKRVGANIIEYGEFDDEGGGEIEVIAWDFEYEGDPEGTDFFGNHQTTLPNTIETTLGGGDSGGPAFMLNPLDPTDNTLYLAGVNTFTFWDPSDPDHDDPALFGAGSGGVFLNSSYQQWIRSVPDMSAWFADGALAGLALWTACRFRRRDG